MRAFVLGLALILPLGAGCLTAVEDAPLQTGSTMDISSVVVPEGASLVEEGGHAILRFADVAFPFRSNFTVPEGVTIVRAVAKVGETLPVSATMFNEETGRRRCNTDVLDAWNLRVTGVSQCSGLAAIDPPGAVWVASATAVGPAVSALEERKPILGTLDVVLETTPLDGIAGRLDLTQLSMPTFELEDTQFLAVPSFDGTPLWVEVTLPQGEGPWPTVLASSPYNGQYGRGGTPAMWTYFTQDWAKRGYAVVNADVRGFGKSGGCVEVWGMNEQKDQAFLVDWVAEQDWSDGNVGFYGQSYVGTTPVAAAVQAPEALKAIIAVAPVINAYDDWHFGGVPNGENTGSPAAYQVLTDTPQNGDPTADPLDFVLSTNKVNGLCDPTLAARANDPRAVYDAFYEERNFTLRAGEVKAAVLYTQGFEDSNVKSAMIPGWFNAITAPKLGVFGHWVHQHPTRADEEILFLGWMDQFVKGKPLGLDRVDPVEVVVDDARHRSAQTWPPVDAVDLALQADFANGALAPEAEASDAPILVGGPAGTGGMRTLEYEVSEDLVLAGVARIAMTVSLAAGGNAWISADLYDVGPDGASLMTYGMFNLAHRDGHDTYAPAAPGEKVGFELPFLPTEHVFPAGHTLRIVLTGVNVDDGAAGGLSQANIVTFHGGEATQLLLPTLPASVYGATPATALR